MTIRETAIAHPARVPNDLSGALATFGAALAVGWGLLVAQGAANAPAHGLVVGDLPMRPAAISALSFVAAALVVVVQWRRAAPATQSEASASFGAANQVTLLRLAMVAWLCGWIGAATITPELSWLLVAVSCVGLSLDGLDGALARATGTASGFGARFDMETDALLVLVLSLLVWRFDRAGIWVIASGAMRYAFVLASWPCRWLARPVPPSLLRKTVCVVQIVCLIVALIPVLPVAASVAVAAAGLALLSFSFGRDVVWLAARHFSRQAISH